MPGFGDIRQFMIGQAFGSTYIPQNADFTGKTIAITGATAGIGLECAKHLARLNVHTLILGCRNLERGKTAKNIIINQPKSKILTSIEVWEVDLANFSSVISFAKRIQQFPRLDAFISNAGIEPMIFQLAEDIEMTLTVNVVSTMLLNIMVLPKLRETSTKYASPTTLTTVGSSVHIFGLTENLLDNLHNKSKDTFDILSDQNTADLGGPDAAMSPRYALSKTILHALLGRLATKASRKDQEVIVNWVNPGWCESEISRHKNAPSLSTKISIALLRRTAEQGSRELINAILIGKESNGCYLSECSIKPESAFLRSKDGQQFADQLWRELMSRFEKLSPEPNSILAQQ
ncbi:NAD(P)-binding protein [Microthyrium microscopicum]|uniref:NAD(P)-binding protein n=1 Tax=Microthyrium microscopicum TaxID=703497 RepID=A0A6A6U938_9PEZI|nr:NAD(P)-binding protein [Microthyrium microscopicum]